MLLHNTTHLKHRQEQTDHYDQHDRRHDEQHDGFQQADEQLQLAALVRFSRLVEMPISTLSRLLLSSPTAIISTTSRGKCLQAESGAASDWPAVILSAERSNASESTLLPVESLLMRMALRIGMPLCNSVPRIA